MSARLLVLDASTETLHLGLAVGAQRLVRALPGGAQASAALLPGLLGLLAEAGLTLRQIDAIGFGRGPGAFTGVRAACAVTQGLAFGADRPVLSLDTLMAVAQDARAQGAGDLVWVAVDARMNEAYAARYRRENDRWQTVEPPALHDPAALARRLSAPAVGVVSVAGSSLAAHAEAWGDLSAPRYPHAVPRAEALLALAQAAWGRGERLPADEALPVYVRDKVAQTRAERTAIRDARTAGASP